MITTKITIITVTYNAEEYLEKTILSVVNQSYSNIEYIIIDGNSSDKTIDIIKQYDSKISYWISEPDKGIYDAMNKGIKNATGEWIQFLNAGDTLTENTTLSNVLPYLTDSYDLIHGLLWRNQGKRELKAPVPIDKAYDGVFIWHPALFCKSSILKEHMFNPFYKIAGDYDFFLKCLSLNYKIKLINIPITDYMEFGVSQQNNLQSIIEVIFAQSQYLKDTKEIFNHNYMKALRNLMPKDNLFFSKNLNHVMDIANDKLKDTQFILYGYGVFGEIIYQKFKHNIVKIIDKDHLKFQENPKVYSLAELQNIEDSQFIFISVLGREEEITDFLIQEHNISPNKIISIFM